MPALRPASISLLDEGTRFKGAQHPTIMPHLPQTLPPRVDCPSHETSAPRLVHRLHQEASRLHNRRTEDPIRARRQALTKQKQKIFRVVILTPLLSSCIDSSHSLSLEC